jgi:hypothetical protein
MTNGTDIGYNLGATTILTDLDVDDNDELPLGNDMYPVAVALLDIHSCFCVDLCSTCR